MCGTQICDQRLNILLNSDSKINMFNMIDFEH